jgi:hypothetical protein
MKLKINNRTSLILWALYLAFIIGMIMIFSSCATSSSSLVQPADMKYTKETVNTHRYLK